MTINVIPHLEIYKLLPDKTKVYNDDFYISYYNHFPILINEDGTLWKYANLYLLYKIKSPNPPHYSTLYSMAKELKAFFGWCLENNVDYLNEKRRVRRPTYMYRFFLQKKLENGINTDTTVKKKMSVVINFYEYLQNILKFKFKFPLWEREDTYISYKDQYGFKQSKKVETKDLLKVPSSYGIDSNEYIQDEGKLKPLTQEEQSLLFRTLNRLGNMEMTLACLIALTTGARIQTVCTLRLKHFERQHSEKEKYLSIKVGLGTDVDTKNDTVYFLRMPNWVYQKIQIYIKSERYKKRFQNQKHIFKNETSQYIFLTNRGTPYYVSKYDEYIGTYTKTIPNGNTIRQFLSATLYRELDGELKFRFHDLRATFAMNLLDSKIYIVEKGEMTLYELLSIIKERMPHKSLLTTERYLNFRNKQNQKQFIQNEFEEYLKGLVD
ncbi:tyrosine-type recombinase/integrase [Aliarcobacter butzleri]|uniref:tyrosine-type recombinase/integrase n=1 Tax=Aliarcobacter butzleri TaxID=28197 RepID=UPI0021B2CE69|nr:site-specific integrase [Aliarcobacter butzleri]MCT7568239.1 site-specific integrase [Aliarcobacter butzleri]